jgi:hypothetical protein
MPMPYQTALGSLGSFAAKTTPLKGFSIVVANTPPPTAKADVRNFLLFSPDS